jgi:hypothetical protein
LLLQIEQIEQQIAQQGNDAVSENLKNLQQRSRRRLQPWIEIKATRKTRSSREYAAGKMDYLQLLETRYDLYQQAYQRS